MQFGRGLLLTESVINSAHKNLIIACKYNSRRQSWIDVRSHSTRRLSGSDKVAYPTIYGSHDPADFRFSTVAASYSHLPKEVARQIVVLHMVFNEVTKENPQLIAEGLIFWNRLIRTVKLNYNVINEHHG